MKRRTFVKNAVSALPAMGAADALASANAGELAPVQLPKPALAAALSLGNALKDRKTTRAISAKALPPQMLSNLLWAAFGVNREAGLWAAGEDGRLGQQLAGDRPVCRPARGIYLYEAAAHRLAPVVAGDCASWRARRAGQGPGKPHLRRRPGAPGTAQEPGLKRPGNPEVLLILPTGLIAGNVYLFAASQGLAAWFHNCDKAGRRRD